MFKYLQTDICECKGFVWHCPNFHNMIKQVDNLEKFEQSGLSDETKKELFQYRYREDRSNYETSVLLNLSLSEYFRLRGKILRTLYTSLLAMNNCATDYNNPDDAVCSECMKKMSEASVDSGYHKPLGVLGLSMRTYKIIVEAGIFYVDDLDNKLEYVLDLEGIGKIRKNEIQNALSVFFNLPTYVPIKPVETQWDENLIMLQGDFGDRLAYILEVKGWSRGELARRIGTHTRTVRYWLEKKNLPDKKNQLLLSNALGVTVHCLLADPTKYKLFERKS